MQLISQVLSLSLPVQGLSRVPLFPLLRLLQMSEIVWGRAETGTMWGAEGLFFLFLSKWETALFTALVYEDCNIQVMDVHSHWGSRVKKH